MATPLVSPKFYAWDPRTGHPLAFGKVFAYESDTNSGGSSQPKATFRNPGATAYNTNPVVLNAAGYADIYLNGTYKIVVTAADGYPVWEADPVSDISRIAEEWIYPTTAMFVSTTEFKVAGSMSDIFVAGRALKLSDTITIYGQIESSYYSAGETFVTISSTQNLSSDLSEVSVGLISSDPAASVSDNIAIAGGEQLNGRGSALYRVSGVEGGSDSYLDGIDGNTGGPIVNNAATGLQSGDMAFVINPDTSDPGFEVYVIDDSSGAVPDGDAIIAPISNPGDKRWIHAFGKSIITKILGTLIYPVGAPFISFTDNRSPDIILGFGTWVAVAGQTLVGYDSTQTEFNAALKAGGSKGVTLTANQSGLRSHGHTTSEQPHDHGYEDAYFAEYGGGLLGSHSTDSDNNYQWRSPRPRTDGAITGLSVNAVSAQDAAESHTNLQPFITAYIWRRTA